jgi:hypothetical protein
VKQWQRIIQTKKENDAHLKEKNERKWQPENDPKQRALTGSEEKT